MTDWLHAISDWANQYALNLVWSGLVCLVYLAITRLALPSIQKGVSQSNLNLEAAHKAQHVMRLIVGTLTLAVLLIVWGVDFSGLLAISTSLITLTGVALFASWSLLSNITSYFVLLFHSSFRRGNFIRIVDGDNYIEGYVDEVNLFNTKLITEDKEAVIYPNNLILTRPTLVSPKQKWRGVGKVADREICSQKDEV